MSNEAPIDQVHKEDSIATARMVPKTFPLLKDRIRVTSWVSLEKMLILTVSETSNFDVLRWIEYMRSQSKDSKKSPFSDCDNNSATLEFSDEQDKQVAVMIFNNLEVKDHCLRCNYKRLFQHSLTLTYHDEPSIFIRDRNSSQEYESYKNWEKIGDSK